MKKYIIFFLIISLLFISGCKNEKDEVEIEREIRNEIVSEIPSIATLEAVYIVCLENYSENYIRSDDIYIQQDSVTIDYGYKIDDDTIKVVSQNDKKILRVTLKKAQVVSVDRHSIESPKTTHKGYIPVDEHGKEIDIDKKMNEEIEIVKAKFSGRNLQMAEENIRSFFKILAMKHNFLLDFSVEK